MKRIAQLDRFVSCSPLILLCLALAWVVGCSRSNENIRGAIQDNDLDGVKKLLRSAPDLIHTRDAEGGGPLHWAALWGHKEMAELLLTHGANVNDRNHRGKTPLHWAATCGHVSIVELLVAKGADVNARTSTGQTPLHSVVVVGTQFPPSQEVAEILLSHGADLNARDMRGFRPLQWAAMLQHRGMARFFLGKGAECDIFAAAALGDLDRMTAILARQSDLVCATNSTGLTPLHWAAVGGTVAVADLLLAHGADVNARDNTGRTPLHEMAELNQIEMAMLLLACRADIEARSDKGVTALECAMANGRHEMAMLLDEYPGER